MAIDAGFDWVWLMDDDAEPDRDCLCEWRIAWRCRTRCIDTKQALEMNKVCEIYIFFVADKTELEILRAVMTKTGLSEAVITSLLLTEDEMDALCDAVLAKFYRSFKKVAQLGR